MLGASLVKSGPVVLEKKIKMRRVYDNNNGIDNANNNDKTILKNGQILMGKVH